MSTLDYFINSILPITAFIFGYLLSSISNAVIIGKIFFKQDPREFGSHNPGGTNAIRLWGYPAGITIIILDMLKAIAPFWIVFMIVRLTSLNDILLYDVAYITIWITALGCIIGHCYSIFLNFKGGKGVSTYMGTLGTSSILQFGCGLITFLSAVFIKKMVSMGSIWVSIIATIISWIMFLFFSFYSPSQNIINLLFIFNPELISMHWSYPIVVTLMSIILLIRHKQNIKRIIKDEENLTY